MKLVNTSSTTLHYITFHLEVPFYYNDTVVIWVLMLCNCITVELLDQNLIMIKISRNFFIWPTTLSVSFLLMYHIKLQNLLEVFRDPKRSFKAKANLFETFRNFTNHQECSEVFMNLDDPGSSSNTESVRWVVYWDYYYSIPACFPLPHLPGIILVSQLAFVSSHLFLTPLLVQSILRSCFTVQLGWIFCFIQHLQSCPVLRSDHIWQLLCFFARTSKDKELSLQPSFCPEVSDFGSTCSTIYEKVVPNIEFWTDLKNCWFNLRGCEMIGCRIKHTFFKCCLFFFWIMTFHFLKFPNYTQTIQNKSAFVKLVDDATCGKGTQIEAAFIIRGHRPKKKKS